MRKMAPMPAMGTAAVPTPNRKSSGMSSAADGAKAAPASDAAPSAVPANVTARAP
jgi:hypothetical protein